MSREVRRVPLDFDFPPGQTWGGYLRPEELWLPTCMDCLGGGETAARRWVGSIARLLLMVGEDVDSQQRDRELHPYLELQNRPYSFVGKSRIAIEPRPSADAAEFAAVLAGSPPDGLFGYGSSGHWRATDAVVKAAGLPENWGTCPTCAGSGEVATPEQKAANEAWEPTEHPTGPGYQLWQTVSEGGPVSPVFAEPEQLADWIIASGKSLHGSNTPRANLIRWIADEGSSVGTMAFVPGGGLVSGVELAAGTS